MNRTVLILILIATWLSLPVYGQSEDGNAQLRVPYDTLAEIAHTYMDKLTALRRFNGVVLLKKDGQLVLKESYNMSADTATTLYVTPDHQFDLRSVAKLFAKATVLQLEKEGLIGREDTIGKYLPGFPNGERITVQHLMDHSSGLPRELNSSISNTLELEPRTVVQLAAKESLEFEPGSRSQYSNVGYQLLYYILGTLCEGSFSGCLDAKYFEPLGMSGSGGNFDEDLSGRSLYAYGHYLDGEGRLQTVKEFPPDDMKMGNLHSTVDDLGSFLESLDPDTFNALLDKGRISQAGGTRGKRAYIERNYKDSYTIVFLANYDQIPFEQLVADLQRILKGEGVDMPKPISREAVHVAPGILKKYVGTYDLVDAGHLLLSIKLENDSLWVYQKGQNNGVLYPESERIFFSDPGSAESLEFVEDPSGHFYLLLDFQGVRWKGVRIAD